MDDAIFEKLERGATEALLLNRIAVLEAELVAKDEFVANAMDACSKTGKEIECLRAELAECKRDAERYRWLRGKLDPADIAILRIRSDPCDAVDAQVDAAIDAALAAKGE